ncbi:hypothetical protein BOX15_Mlig016192g2 [Macrostomum lignano]|uniref:type I protein arginine methyltransferase n=1 Tax=Macrostomum lignano TaxID=282301 RepID=A0A267GBP2_9PLAT|nr:hypothetical protein BOX15_Mlig016192g2 [Macrostomum lignano]
MVYENVTLRRIKDDPFEESALINGCSVELLSPCSNLMIVCKKSGESLLSLSCQFKEADIAQVSHRSLSIYTGGQGHILCFPTENDLTTFQRRLREFQSAAAEKQKQQQQQQQQQQQAQQKKNPQQHANGADKHDSSVSVFDQRTETASSAQYFQFYSFLSQQQNMLQDYIRTATYQRAVLSNVTDFQDKVVMDVGAGSGILSFFAAQAGARRVYAVEASNMSAMCERLVRANNLQDRITVVTGKIEEVDIPEKVDTLISEPMGYMLFNERMLESYLHAKKWLKPTGKMFPSVAHLYCAPFSDEALFGEQVTKANFWWQQFFYGVDLSCLRDEALAEYLRQPVVDTWDSNLLIAAPIRHTVDFRSASETDLHLIDVPLNYTVAQAALVHGLAFWFDVGFLGSQSDVWLSTAPTEPLTHWYQVRCLFSRPLFVQAGQNLRGRLIMKANERQSYDVEIELQGPADQAPVRNCLDLKNPCFRYTGAVAPPAVPGASAKPPSEAAFPAIVDESAAATAAAAAAAAAAAGGPAGGHVMFGLSAPTSTMASVSGGGQPCITTAFGGAPLQQHQQPLPQSPQLDFNNLAAMADTWKSGNGGF